ncbi:MAG: hypothetical protein SNJ82_12300 [Gemmataceae bacterium]
MVRYATWLCLAFVPLALLGWASTSHGFFEVVRFLAIASLMLGFVLFFIAYIRTPDPPNSHQP